jgi:hypothetical protein
MAARHCGLTSHFFGWRLGWGATRFTVAAGSEPRIECCDRSPHHTHPECHRPPLGISMGRPVARIIGRSLLSQDDNHSGG